jgi:phosphate starvation-inducible PhoH-like protein
MRFRESEGAASAQSLNQAETKNNREGRAQPLTAQVLTPSGYRPMGDIHVGDEVIAVDGSTTAVSGVYPQGVRPIYRITLSDGSTTRASFDHLWSVREEEAADFEVLSTGEIVLDMSEGRRYEIHPLSDTAATTIAGIQP